MRGDQIAVKTERGNTFYVTDNMDEGKETAECQYCGEEIIWCKTAKDKNMPVDVPEEPGMPTTSHFATCEFADQARKPR